MLLLLLAAAVPMFGPEQLSRAQAAGDVKIEQMQSDRFALNFASSENGGSVTLPIAPEARDLTRFGSLQFTFRSTSTIKWNLQFRNAKGETTTFRVMPYQGVRATASIPVRFFTTEFLDNRAFLAYAMANWSNHIDVADIRSVTIQMAPDRPVVLEFGPMVLNPGVVPDSAELSGPLVDEYGQWIGDHPLTREQIEQAWRDEKFEPFTTPERLKLKATGYFHTQQANGVWWFVDPDGQAFFSLGMDCVRRGDTTPLKGREKLFVKPVANFYESNIALRGGKIPWKDMSERRLQSWGFNTVANWSDQVFRNDPKMPVVFEIHLQSEKQKNWEGYPDVFSDSFRSFLETQAASQCAPHAKDRQLMGYFIGNEPHWQNRHLVDRILQDPEATATQKQVKQYISAHGRSDDQLLELLSREYFQRVVAAIKSADPNHLVLGIRWAGNAPDAVVRANDAFDVFSINIYKFEPDRKQIEQIYKLCHRPILIGEFHFGAAERGMAPSLVMVKNQKARGVAYAHYVEQAAAMPEIIGTHYFQFIDEPVTGRYDGENYNLGFVSEQDIPYTELVDAAKDVHRRVYRIHQGTQ